MTGVRIRGIYATALTALLRDAVPIVHPSPTIEQRFDHSFEMTDWTVQVETTPDRQGIGVTGAPGDIEAVCERIEAIGRDVFAWEDAAPLGAVFQGEIIEELGRGAIVDLGEREAFLPYGATQEYVAEGDTLEVQVHDPVPPWSDHRSVVGTDMRVYGGMADLVGGNTKLQIEGVSSDQERELIRRVELLEIEIPAGWTLRLDDAATTVALEVLERAIERVVTKEARRRSPGVGGDVSVATRWVWFGREMRFELDEWRRSIVTTMPGHHRIKVCGEAASAAVGFVERVGTPDEFPVGAVLSQFGPSEGDSYRIEHGKPSGRRFSLGEGTVLDRDDATITVRREMSGGGQYDALETPREDGDWAVTKLKEGRWWYPTVYRNAAGESKGLYVNICTPVELFARRATYMDLEVDVIRRVDGTVERVDDDDLDAAVETGNISPELAKKARDVASAVTRALSD